MIYICGKSFFEEEEKILFGAAGIGGKFVGEKNRGNEKSNCNQGCPGMHLVAFGILTYI